MSMDSHFIDWVVSRMTTAMDSDELISVYLSSTDFDTFSVGLPLRVSETHFALGEVDPNGYETGAMVAPLGDVARVQTSGGYLHSIEALFTGRALPEGTRFAAWNSIKTLDSAYFDYEAALSVASSTGFVVTLTDYDGGTVTGTVAVVGSDYVVIDVISRKCIPDGQTGLALESIRTIEIEGIKERAFSRLRELGT